MKPSFSLWRVVVLAATIAVVATGVAWKCGLLQPLGLFRPANSLIILVPYQYGGTWVFDDPVTSLKREPFVSGIPQIIDFVVRDIPTATNGFRLLFSTQPFPGYQEKLTWVKPQGGGNIYRMDKPPMEGWLCPALFRYYRTAPRELYVKAEPKS